MPVKVICPHCESALRLPDDLYDRPAQCPRCGGAFEMLWKQNPRQRRAGEANGEPAAGDENARRACPFCGKPIKHSALKCRHCRKWLEEDGERGA